MLVINTPKLYCRITSGTCVLFSSIPNYITHLIHVHAARHEDGIFIHDLRFVCTLPMFIYYPNIHLKKWIPFHFKSYADKMYALPSTLPTIVEESRTVSSSLVDQARWIFSIVHRTFLTRRMHWGSSSSSIRRMHWGSSSSIRRV